MRLALRWQRTYDSPSDAKHFINEWSSCDPLSGAWCLSQVRRMLSESSRQRAGGRTGEWDHPGVWLSAEPFTTQQIKAARWGEENKLGVSSSSNFTYKPRDPIMFPFHGWCWRPVLYLRMSARPPVSTAGGKDSALTLKGLCQCPSAP